MTSPAASPSDETTSFAHRIASAVTEDKIAGALLLGATVLALVFANTAAAPGYTAVRDFTFGIEAWKLDLSVGRWAADGLLAIFFFVVGLELKEEFVSGSLRNPRAAAVPIAAAIGGVVLPASIYVVINLLSPEGALEGWAIPAATDIAFALAVVAVVGKFLPPALRVFLLTLAVVDDLIAISIIAIFYTEEIAFLPLAVAIIPLALFAIAVQRGVRAWWILLPLAIAVWVLIHASGIHATVAGVLLGFMVPVLASERARVRIGTTDDGAAIHDGLAHHFVRRVSPISMGFAVPVFAFFSAGVTVGGFAGFIEAVTNPVAVGIILALVFGKPIGITATTWLVTRFSGLRIDSTVTWLDVLGISFIAGIGFTVSLLIGELSFGVGSALDDVVKVGVLLGSLIAALIGSLILVTRNRVYRRRSVAALSADPTPG